MGQELTAKYMMHVDFMLLLEIRYQGKDTNQNSFILIVNYSF